MKNGLLVLWVLIGFASCKEKSNHSQSFENKEVAKIFDWKLFEDKFKFKNLKAFELKGDTIEKDLVKIDADIFFKVTQDSFHFDNFYFYSYQIQDSNFTKLTIMHKSQEWLTYIIWYLIYDKNGKLLSKTVVAESGSGEDRWSSVKSKFINDSTLIIDSNENRLGETDDSEMKNIKLQKEIIFQDNGRTKERLISKTEKLIKIGN